MDTSHLIQTYAPMPVAFTHGEGAWLWDEQGRRVLDGISGLGVTALGHGHPELAAVIADQAGKLLHTGNLVEIPWQGELAGRLARHSGMQRAFFGNSGAEAIECALKISRVVGHARGIDKPQVVVMKNSFHGRTMAALSATGSRKVQAGFEPLVSGFVRAPFGDIEALESISARSQDVVAILAEPIQGESGIRIPADGYLERLRSICDERGWLLILDEIQSGLCRSGRWYAYQHENILPDVVTTAKALANGLPIGACLARGDAAEALKVGQHGSTFGGGPLVSRAACTVLDIMERDQISERAESSGQHIVNALNDRIGHLPQVVNVRGRGLMMGVELDRDVNSLKTDALEKGLLLNVTHNNVIRLLPPLIIDRQQADMIVDIVSELVESL